MLQIKSTATKIPYHCDAIQKTNLRIMFWEIQALRKHYPQYAKWQISFTTCGIISIKETKSLLLKCLGIIYDKVVIRTTSLHLIRSLLLNGSKRIWTYKTRFKMLRMWKQWSKSWWKVEKMKFWWLFRGNLQARPMIRGRHKEIEKQGLNIFKNKQ